MESKRKTKVARLKRRGKSDGPNPVFKKGDRNLFCPHYCDCLDFAIFKSWDYWACFDCDHKKQALVLDDFPATKSETVLYHSLPQELYLRVG
jgi:hypothetical protein